MKVALLTLAVGAVAGFLAQRSRLCFVGGLRDFLLVRDTDLIQGAVAFFLAAWITFPVLALWGGPVWEPGAVVAAASPAAVAPVPAADPPAGEGPRTAPPGTLCGALQARGTAVLPYLAVLAGLGLGALATLSDGCPLRQHVLAAQGAGDARWWLCGFYAGALVYHRLVFPALARCLG